MSLMCECLSNEFPLLLPLVWMYSPLLLELLLLLLMLLPELLLLLLPDLRLGFFCLSILGGTFGKLGGASEPFVRGGEIRFGG